MYGAISDCSSPITKAHHFTGIYQSFMQLYNNRLQCLESKVEYLGAVALVWFILTYTSIAGWRWRWCHRTTQRSKLEKTNNDTSLSKRGSRLWIYQERLPILQCYHSSRGRCNFWPVSTQKTGSSWCLLLQCEMLKQTAAVPISA